MFRLSKTTLTHLCSGAIGKLLLGIEWFNFTGRKQTKLAVKTGFEPMRRTETAQNSHRTRHQKGSLLP